MTEMALRPTDLPPAADPTPAGLSTTVLDVVVPVYDEERDLERCVRRLHAHLREQLPYEFRITVADNASTDGTLAIGRRLAAELDRVAVIHLPQKGRGRALRAAWSASDAQVLAYMDVDLSTDLSALLPLVAPLVAGHSDLAIGTRLGHGARVVRGVRREVISRAYNLLLRGTMRTHFTDAQCGFKAVRRDVAQRLLPLVQDDAWFFDTELLVQAERSGLRIHEVPVDWVDDPDSRVRIVPTALADLRGVWRLGWQGARFAVVGAVSTLAYLVLYVVLRVVVPAQAANTLALLATAVVNTAVNRRWTFGVRGRSSVMRHQVQGLGVFVLGWLLTSGALLFLHGAEPHAGRWTEVTVLVGANLVATVLRFSLFRWWVFAPRTGRGGTAVPR